MAGKGVTPPLGDKPAQRLGKRSRSSRDTSSENATRKNGGSSPRIRLKRHQSGMKVVSKTHLPSLVSGSEELIPDSQAAESQVEPTPSPVVEHTPDLDADGEGSSLPSSTPSLSLHITPDTPPPTESQPPTPTPANSQPQNHQPLECPLCGHNLGPMPSAVKFARHLRDSHSHSEYYGLRDSLRNSNIKICHTCHTPWACTKAGNIWSHNCDIHISQEPKDDNADDTTQHTHDDTQDDSSKWP